VIRALRRGSEPETGIEPVTYALRVRPWQTRSEAEFMGYVR
jgi:hypothetical protein